ncbi:tetraspanin-7-like isoform X3 [Brachyistius frenatus]|uniref:tetraspanin-7-like isoform X3 n=1 Tax=Brachyistius frenatus TaxID=100188 RepID=UPI0037E95CB7
MQVRLVSRFGWSRFCCCPGSVGPDSVGFQVRLVQVLLVSRFGWCRFCWCPGSVGPGSVIVQVWLVQVLLLSRFCWSRFCWFPGSVGPGSVGIQVLLVQVRLVQVLLLSRFGWSRFGWCPGSVGLGSVGVQVRLVQVLLVSRFGWCRFGWCRFCWCPGSVGSGSVVVQVLLVQFLCPESHTVLAMVLCSVAPPPQVTGVVLLSVGLWWRFLLGPYMLLISGSPSNAPYVLTGTGAAIVLFGLFGCFSACRGRPWMLRLYAAFLFLVFMTELIAGISGFVFRHEIKGTFLTTYSDAVLRYDGRDDRSLAVDGVQRRLHCCGVQNFTSWLNSFYFPLGGIPVSCCVDLSDCSADDLKNATAAARKVHKQGCYELVVSFLETHMGIIAGVMFGVAFSQLVGTSLACCLSRFINANQYEMV